MSPKYCYIVIRIFYSLLAIGVFLSLFEQETDLRSSLVYGQGVGYGVLYLCMFIMSLSMYFITCLVKPGFVVASQNQVTAERAELMPSPLKRFCSKCNVNQLMRSHHCDDCNRCVQCFDHHCPFMETCIGERNHKWYWWYLLLTTPLMWWSCLMAWNALQPTLTWSQWIHANIFFVIEIVILLVFGVATTGLLVFHTYLIMHGTTTWEVLSRERITYLKNLHEDYNPFDEGIARNMLRFLCSPAVTQWELLYKKRVKQVHNSSL